MNFVFPFSRALAEEKYAGCIDAVGERVLANILSQLKYGGTAAICGLAAGEGFGGATVRPFIIRFEIGNRLKKLKLYGNLRFLGYLNIERYK